MPTIQTAGGGMLHVGVHLDAGAVHEFLLTARANLDDLSPAWRVIAENLRQFETKVFDEEGKPILGRAWDELKPRTVAARRGRWGHYRKPSNEGPARRILHWTHRLRDSLTKEGHADQIEDVSPQRLRFGSLVEYAPYHVKRRPFLDLPRAFVITDVVQPIQRYVLGETPRAGQRRRTRRVFDRLPISEAAD